MKPLITKLLGSVSLLTAVAQAFPPSVDIGVYSIDNYSANGGGMPDLAFQVSSAQNFFAAALANVPAYSAAKGGNVKIPSLGLDARNSQVTKAAIISTGSSWGEREYCDFAYYGGHGISETLFLGLNGPYGQVFPSNLSMGVGYNRWFMAHGCASFGGAGDPAITWQPIFKGLKAMLGFKSLIWDNNLNWSLFNEFWLNWTSRERGLFTAFSDAETNYGYKHLYPTKGLETGCLSAQVIPGQTDYCWESFLQTGNDYTPATENTGTYYSCIIGNPQY